VAIAEMGGKEVEDPPYDCCPKCSGTPKDQVAVGLRYLGGSSVCQSTATAMLYLEDAAKAGSGTAMYILGQIYGYGMCTDRSVPVAVKWYKWGAEKDNGPCAYELGCLYEDGTDVTKSPQMAFDMYVKASESDSDEDVRADAFYALGSMYGRGSGTARSDEMSLESYVRSADLGHAGAQYIAGKLFADSGKVERAREYLRKAAEQGDNEAEKILDALS